MKIDHNNRRFKPIQNSENGEIGKETIFEYKQEGNIVTFKYNGRQITKGH